jgi:protein-disulfide isomerase
VKTFLSVTTLLVLSMFGPSLEAQQAAAAPAAAAPAGPSPIQKSVEAYLRNLYAFGSDVQLTVGPLKETPIAGLMETDVAVKIGEDKQVAQFYVSRDGKFLFRGELSDLSKDPLAETRAKIQTRDAAVLGPTNAPVTLVEFSDFECPVCRNLHDALRALLPKYAQQVRVIFKDYPIEQIHPWARTAAIAGRCAYQQDPQAFWKVYDQIYDHQDVISAENAWDKMQEYASQSGLNADTFKSCMASPEPGAAINASLANGQALEVNSTPTIFINGRRLVGADAHLIEQYLEYELARPKSAKSND